MMRKKVGKAIVLAFAAYCVIALVTQIIQWENVKKPIMESEKLTATYYDVDFSGVKTQQDWHLTRKEDAAYVEIARLIEKSVCVRDLAQHNKSWSDSQELIIAFGKSDEELPLYRLTISSDGSCQVNGKKVHLLSLKYSEKEIYQCLLRILQKSN